MAESGGQMVTRLDCKCYGFMLGVESKWRLGSVVSWVLYSSRHAAIGEA